MVCLNFILIIMRIINIRSLLAVSILYLSITHAIAQRQPVPVGTISGSLIDSISGSAVDYATVALFKLNDKQLVNGTLSKHKGKFFFDKLNPGKYYLEISFMGYLKKTIPDIFINPSNTTIELGNILLHRSVKNLEEVVIAGDAPAIDYKIDKKVINVSKQITSTSGTAVDVLENVPSVQVDIEGNVSLRGSTGFTVLIDGRPSILDPNDALQQIPASTIDNIEIITNPSVKYDPDGNAGIFNIITKKNKLKGVSGIVNLNAGLDEKYGGDFLLNYKTIKANYFIGGDYNVRNHPGDMVSERETMSNDTSYFINSAGSHARKRNNYGIRAGAEFNINDKNYLSAGIRYGYREHDGDSKLDFEEWTEPGSGVEYYTNHEQHNRGGDFVSINSNYERKFGKKDQKLIAEITYDIRNGEEYTITELSTLSGEITNGYKSTEDGPSRRIRAKLDYTHPVGENGKIEAGYQSRIGKSEDNTESFILNLANNNYESQPEYSHTTNYNRSIHSLYGIYAGEAGNFGYQAGVREEYTWRKIETTYDSETFKIDRWDFFPTLHMSYNLPKENQLMASYSKRIERPRGWYLEPFQTWMDAYNLRQGNPGLQPEFIDSYEIAFLKKFSKTNFLSVESYYKVTHNKIERVRTVYSENVMLHTMENVGNDYSLGVEFMFSYMLNKWWKANLMTNFYRYKVEGTLYSQDFSNESNNWSIRFNNDFSIRKNTKIQINSIYNGPSANAQGESEGFFMLNTAVRQDFYDKKFTAVLQLRDLLATAKHSFASSGADFVSNMEFTRKSPEVTLTLTYRFNNYNADRKKGNGNGGGDMDEGDMY
jgi:outer membrane receptor protein involved in Fe transport